jgi:hypothetical protein
MEAREVALNKLRIFSYFSIVKRRKGSPFDTLGKDKTLKAYLPKLRGFSNHTIKKSPINLNYIQPQHTPTPKYIS